MLIELFITRIGEELISIPFTLRPQPETGECEINHSQTTIAEIKNARTCVPISQYAFVNEYGKQSPSSLKHEYLLLTGHERPCLTKLIFRRSYGTDTKYSSICQYLSEIPDANFFLNQKIYSEIEKKKQTSVRPEWSLCHRVGNIFKQVPLHEELWVSGS